MNYAMLALADYCRAHAKECRRHARSFRMWIRGHRGEWLRQAEQWDANALDCERKARMKCRQCDQEMDDADSAEGCEDPFCPMPHEDCPEVSGEPQALPTLGGHWGVAPPTKQGSGVPDETRIEQRRAGRGGPL